MLNNILTVFYFTYICVFAVFFLYIFSLKSGVIKAALIGLNILAIVLAYIFEFSIFYSCAFSLVCMFVSLMCILNYNE
jgi:hypothetical protein